MEAVTIVETYTLPSKGLIYKTPFDPIVNIRSMTLAEEMRRLQTSQEVYRPMADVIDACIENKLPISSYDMCLGDYQFLLHKLRIVTYGTNYKIGVVCPVCGERTDTTIDLDSLKIIELPDDYQSLMEVKLPRSGDVIKLKFKTPRILDTISKETKDMKKQYPDLGYDPSLLIELQNSIDEVNGKKMSKLALNEYVKKLQMIDVNKLMQHAAKLDSCVGVNPLVDFTCKECGNDSQVSFRFTPEFFTPTN